MKHLFCGDVAHALVRAVSRLVSTPLSRAGRRPERRRGTQECVRHKNTLRNLSRYLGIGLVSLTLAAQQKSAPPKSAPPPTVDAGVIRLDVTNVNLLFTVSDKKGRFVSDLTREDFEILENKKPQVISQFTAETNLPLRLAILMDTSSSIRDRFRFIQTAASDFVNTTVRQGQDKATIFSFDSNAELVADMTDDTADLGVKIRGMRPGGGTAMYDAIYAACRDKLMPEQPREKFRRAVIILSDGEDNQSRWTREQALEMAHRADAVIYTISTNITHTDTSGDRILKHFAEETGGIAFFPFKAEDLSQSFENIGNELRHQYNVFYVPNPLRADGLYHTVDIKVKEHKDAVVRARHGYYAPLYK